MLTAPAAVLVKVEDLEKHGVYCEHSPERKRSGDKQIDHNEYASEPIRITRASPLTLVPTGSIAVPFRVCA